MIRKVKQVAKAVFLCFVALSIPGMLVFNAIQARRYTDLRRQVLELERKQQDLVEENKKLITDISVLSGTDRIEQIAGNELQMRKAETDEIVRVEMKDSRHERN